MIAQSWKCTECGFVAVGLFPPQKCPKCGAGAESFETKGDWKFPPERMQEVVEACWKVSYGLYIVSSVNNEGKINGQVCNTLFQVTSDPPRLAIAINHINLTHEYILESGVFAASILGKNDHSFVRRFGYRSGRDFDKFKGVDIVKKVTGAPILSESIGYLECVVIPEKTVDAGTHSIFIGDIVGGEVFKKGEEPMTYAYYHETKDSSQK